MDCAKHDLLGIVSILTRFVHTAQQFYVTRLLLELLSLAFSGMIVYLNPLVCSLDRSQASLAYTRLIQQLL